MAYFDTAWAGADPAGVEEALHMIHQRYVEACKEDAFDGFIMPGKVHAAVHQNQGLSAPRGPLDHPVAASEPERQT